MRAIFVCLIALGIGLLDQASKLWVERSFLLGESMEIWEPFIRLTHTTNTGAAFGLFREHPGLLSVMGFAVILGLLLFIVRQKSFEARAGAGMACILGGAIGNMTDRIFRGAVVDFLDIGFHSHRWPAFNLADSLITAGILILWLTLLRKSKTHAPRAS